MSSPETDALTELFNQAAGVQPDAPAGEAPQTTEAFLAPPAEAVPIYAAPVEQAPVYAAPAVDYSAQIAQMQAQNAQALQQAAYYRGLAEAAAQRNTAPAPVTQPVIAPDYSLTLEEQATYAADIPLIQKIAAQAAASHTAELNAFRAQAAETLNRLNVSSEQQRIALQDAQFEQSIVRAVPDLAAFKESAEWRTYLNTLDPERGVPRQQIIEHYSNANNAAAVIYHINQARASAVTLPAIQTSPQNKPAATVAPVPTPIGRTAGQPIPPSVSNSVLSISHRNLVGDQGLQAKLQNGKITRDAYEAALEAAFNGAATGANVTA